ncbi:uncharacterized protein LOC129230060 isoform X2 [Uloborus diversus]|uniref:uncharacterized protein LOC129230060 isoform X2 n=1 Tax=Uloborus diversus TaxID=327109 RepID=UPI00240939C5|nr:uncharacterized protein LOC129230060 isoform X2 [Uloborus diversus]
MSSSKTESLSMNDEEIEYANFIKQRIENSGGSVKFQHLTGHLSQLSLNIRKAVGGGTQELMKFLRKHHNIFTIDPKGNVSVKQSAAHLFSPLTLPEEEKSHNSLPLKLEGHGVAINVHPTFGFINAKHPFKTTVYFCPSNFENGKGSLLTDFNLFVGCKLFFNAVLGNPNFEAKYKAVKVWKPLEPEDPPDEPIKPKLRKNRDSGLYDPNMKEGEGVVHKVFPTHAFITVEDDPNSSVFFHKNHLSKYSNVVDLSEVVKVGTVVEFSAMRSTKSDAKARWEATKVWIKGTKSKKKSSKKNDEMYLSDDDSVYDNYSVGSSNSLLDTKAKKESHVKTYNSLLSREAKQKNNMLLANESGQFFPRTSGSVIKFGPNLAELADADSTLFYSHGAKVVEKLWEFSDGDKVQFDAVRIKSAPGWKAVLAWVGEKPDVVLSSEDFGLSDDEASDISDVQISNEPTVSPSFKKTNREFINSNYKKQNKLPPKSSISSLDLESEKDSGIYVFPENKKPKESFLSLADIEKGASRSLQSSRTGSLTSLNSSKGSQKSSKKSKHNKDSRVLSNTHHNSSEKVISKYTSSRKSNFNWADTPCSDDEEEHSQFADREHEIAVDNVKELNQNYSNFEDSGIMAKFGDLLANSDDDDDDVTDQNSIADCNENNDLVSDNQNDLSNDNLSNSNFKPYVKFFEGILGTVTTAYSRFIRIESKALQDSAVCGFNDIYRNGTPISDHFDDVKEVVKDGDTLKFNCFEVLDDSNQYWLVVTMAWKGNKPKVDQMTVEEFLASRPDISVTIEDESKGKPTCDTSSESMRLLNDKSEATGSKKYLSVVQTNIEDEDLNVNSELSSDEPIQMISAKNEIASVENKKKFLTEIKQLNSEPTHEPIQMISAKKQMTSKEKKEKFLTELQSREEGSSSSSSSSMLALKISRMLISEGIVNDDSMENLHNISLEIINLVLKESSRDTTSISSVASSFSNDRSLRTEVNLLSQDIASQTNNFSASPSSNSSSNKAVQTIITGEVFSQSIFTQ